MSIGVDERVCGRERFVDRCEGVAKGRLVGGVGKCEEFVAGDNAEVVTQEAGEFGICRSNAAVLVELDQ